MTAETVAQILIYAVINGALYGLVALGLSLVYGVMRYLNIAHGSLIMLGAYGSFWLFHYWGIDPFASIPLTMLGLFAIGIILYIAMFSFLVKFPERERIKNSLLIGFGLLLILDNSAILLWTSDERSVTTFYTGASFSISGVSLPYIGLLTIGLALIVVFCLYLLLTKTYFGKSIRAAAQNSDSASLMGINLGWTYLVSFAIGIALAAVPSATISLAVINPAIGIGLLCKALIVVVLAGMGSIGGLFVAGQLLGILEAAAVFFIGTAYREVFGLIVFLIVLLVRPQGLFGKKLEM